MRSGVRIAIDVGRARVGVARSDGLGMLAVPVETVPREPAAAALQRISDLVRDYEAIEIVVGLPINLKGEQTPSTADAIGFAQSIALSCAVPVRTVDERLSTRTASRELRESGVSARSQRPLIDQQAAVVILQQALETERLRGVPAGDLLELPERPPE